MVDGPGSTPPGGGSGVGGGSGADNNNDAIRRVPVKLPVFWKVDVRLWFCQVEAVFVTYGIVSEKARYYQVVACVEGEVLSQISDLIVTIPEDTPYTILKQRLIARYADSEQARLQKLLDQIPLGDKRPSHVLQEMRGLAGAQVTTEFLKSLWTKRLPLQTQLILKASDADLDGLAKLADQIGEVSMSTNSQVMSINTAADTATSTFSSNEIMRKQISELTNRLNKYEARSRSQSRSNKNNSTRDRSKTPSGKELCWYHHRFGDRATKCRGECKFQLKNE